MTSTYRQAAILVGALLLAGCGGQSVASNTTETKTVTSASPVASPTSDTVTTLYVALVHSYWIQYVTARGDGATVCWDAVRVDPPKCRQRAASILAAHEKFLSDLDTTPLPPKFAADDQVFRSQLPKAITAVKAMISASESGDKQAVLQATTAYVNEMIPIVTGALDHVDPRETHG